ncbi:MAG TPA: cytochrome P450 [Polyangiaceae bacterium]|nr:cytochrome P450 [Polyangiaceae bacterium]
MSQTLGHIPSRLPPGPPPPRHVLDELLYLRDLKQDVLGTVAQRFATYGDVYYGKIRGQGIFSAMDPEFLRSVLVTEASSFRRRTIDLEFLGNGVLTSTGEDWRRKRRRLQPGFRHDSVLGYAALIGEETERMLARVRPGSRLELHSSLRDLTLRVVCRALFGQQFTGNAERLGHATRVLQEAVLRPKFLPSWMTSPAQLRHRRMQARVDRDVYRILERAESDPGSLLSQLRAQQAASGEDGPESREELRDEVVTLLLAGHETTALALTWAFYLLALHPEQDERLAEEIARVSRGERIDGRHFAELEATGRVLKEAVRLYPPVYVIPRVCTAAVDIGRYRVSAGDELWLWVYFMHHDARWFSLPERFNPERFLSEGAGAFPPHAYIPFGAGSRSCIGQGFAMLEAVLVIAQVLQRFRLVLSDSRPVFLRPRITLAPARSIEVRLEPRRGTRP